jgi:hypothetical protein
MSARRASKSLLERGVTNPTVIAGHSRLKDGVASASLCPAIHVLALRKKDVDARHKAGHDEWRDLTLLTARHYVKDQHRR